MKFISLQEVEAYRKKGWKAADLHVHSNESYDVLPDPNLDPEVLYKKAKARGMDFFTISDHDTMDGYKRLAKRTDIVTSVEIKILDKINVGHTLHINVYTLNKQQFLELEYIASVQKDIYKFIAYLRKNKLPYLYNHPYWVEIGDVCHHKNIEIIAKHFPIIELNLGRVKQKNDLALRLAKKHHKGMMCNTDTHTGDIGVACTLAPGKNFKEWWNNVCKGNCVLVRKDIDVQYFVAEVNRRIDSALNPHLRQEHLDKFTHMTMVKAVDFLVRMLLTARKYALTRWFLKGLLKLLSYTRVPAVIFVRSERKEGHKLTRAIHAS